MLYPKPGQVPSVVWTENIVIWWEYLNPVSYSPEKTVRGDCIHSLIFFVFKPSGDALNLKEEENKQK